MTTTITLLLGTSQLLMVPLLDRWLPASVCGQNWAWTSTFEATVIDCGLEENGPPSEYRTFSSPSHIHHTKDKPLGRITDAHIHNTEAFQSTQKWTQSCIHDLLVITAFVQKVEMQLWTERGLKVFRGRVNAAPVFWLELYFQIPRNRHFLTMVGLLCKAELGLLW